LSERPNEQTIALPPALQSKVEDAQAAWHSKDNTRRLWSKDATLWTGGDEGNWLGWLDSIDSERRDVERPAGVAHTHRVRCRCRHRRGDAARFAISPDRYCETNWRRRA
jgi:hypothetical protein